MPCKSDKPTTNLVKPKLKTLIKSKKSMCVITVALVLVCAIVSSLFIFTSCSADNTVFLSRDFVIKDGDYTYFSGNGILFDITNQNTPHPLSADDKQVIFFSEKTCFDGDIIYSVYAKDKNLIKYTVKDSVAKSEIWVDSKTLKDRFDSLLNNKKRTPTDIFDLSICDGYVFFYYNPVVTDSTADTENAYRIGKISLDGSDIDFLDSNIRASSLITKGDYIYYYDNGFDSYSTDFDRAGIYRMKSDGSQKELLFNDFGKIDTSANAPMLCNNFKIFGDHLYFIADTAKGKSRVCKLALDGSEYEYLTKKGAHRFTLDPDNEILYYSEGEMQKSLGKPRPVYKASLSDNKESFMFNVDGNREFTVSDNYLYISDCYHFPFDIGSYSIIGERFDCDKNAMEFLCCEQEKQGIAFDPAKDAYVYHNGGGEAKYYWSNSSPYNIY